MVDFDVTFCPECHREEVKVCRFCSSRVPPSQAVPASSEMPPRVWLAMMDAREVPMMDGIYFQVENAVSLSPTNEHDQPYLSLQEATALISAEREKGRREAFEEAMDELAKRLGKITKLTFFDIAEAMSAVVESVKGEA